MNQIKEIADTFGVDWPHLIAQIISFIIVCVLLYFFAYKRVLATLEARRLRITEGLANAERTKAELDHTEAQRAEVLAQANAQAVKLIEAARAAAARIRENETQKAIAYAEQIIAQAREATKVEHAHMLAELKREVGRLVVKTTATITGKILTAQDQQYLAAEAAQQIST
jgi:F-type H+-transporting ATPase subunit b